MSEIMKLTDTAGPGTDTTDSPPDTGAEQLLRRVLLVNAGSSLLTGLFGLGFAGTAGQLIGVDQGWLIRAVGAGLVLFALGVLAVARGDERSLVDGAAVISINDFGWVLATVCVAAVGWLSTSGVVIMGLIAVMVGGFGLVQLMARRSLTSR